MSTDRYSQHAKIALRNAHYLARQAHHSEVDTDHLFVGIWLTTGCVGHQVLTEFALDEDTLLDCIDHLHHSLSAEMEKLPFSDSLRMALGYAVAEAQWLEHDYIGTEHLLLGLLRTGRGQLPELLNMLDLSPEHIQGRIKRLVNDGVNEVTMETARGMDRLSELGKRVLNAAEQLARDLGSEIISPHHVLLALARERRGMAYRALPVCGLQIDLLEEDLAHLPPRALRLQTMLNQIIDGAVVRADILGMHYTGTEHILLSMALHDDGQALLRHYGVDLDCLQNHLRDVLLR
jgi:ATP-dependent Clp protease ATP-binding subunit ClpA